MSLGFPSIPRNKGSCQRQGRLKKIKKKRERERLPPAEEKKHEFHREKQRSSILKFTAIISLPVHVGVFCVYTAECVHKSVKVRR